MNSNSTLRLAVIPSALLALIGAAGCQSSGHQAKSCDFFVDTEIQSIQSTLEQQKVNGARHDAMLRDQHFDGGRLNALGRAKLDRMLAEPGVVMVYLPGSADRAVIDSKRQAVLAYAKDRGRAEADVQVVPGINPATLHPTAAELARIDKTELGTKPDKGSTPADVSANTEGLGLSGNNSPGYSGSTGKGSMQ